MELTVPDVIELRPFTSDDLPTVRQLLIDVHADAYADQMDDEFHQRFPWFVDHWGAMNGFTCVVAYDGDEPVGFAYGAPAGTGREWWREYLVPAPEDPSTFSVSELMVRPQWRKRGISERLHHSLLRDRPEALAVLLVDTTHRRVEALYEAWGYRRVGTQRPFADSPLYAVMVAELPLIQD
ncbi:GNAT family N-acetyltransferase [Streptomyces sp. NPDC093221]|uniref:GNAT family N-acetyltransferase n=1 Tax=Streptomyces sp. NPDC093221 TaxID=3366032 RepID=UPI0037FE28CB